jgi:hypothetical protein
MFLLHGDKNVLASDDKRFGCCFSVFLSAVANKQHLPQELANASTVTFGSRSFRVFDDPLFNWSCFHVYRVTLASSKSTAPATQYGLVSKPKGRASNPKSKPVFSASVKHVSSRPKKRIQPTEDIVMDETELPLEDPGPIPEPIPKPKAVTKEKKDDAALTKLQKRFEEQGAHLTKAREVCASLQLKMKAQLHQIQVSLHQLHVQATTSASELNNRWFCTFTDIGSDYFEPEGNLDEQ